MEILASCEPTRKGRAEDEGRWSVKLLALLKQESGDRREAGSFRFHLNSSVAQTWWALETSGGLVKAHGLPELEVGTEKVHFCPASLVGLPKSPLPRP